MKRSPLKRRTPMKRSPMRRRRRSTSYSRRDRDIARMLWIKENTVCAVTVEPMPWKHTLTSCIGEIQADHAGQRAMGRKAPDDTCIGLCAQHHLDRTSHCGVFKHAKRDEIREWLAIVIESTRALYDSRSPAVGEG